MLFPTTIAGSLPKPEWLAEPNMLWAPWKAKGEELASAKRDATLLAIKLQEDAGVDIVTEGEQARQHFVHGFLERIEGIDFAHKVEMGIRKDRYKAMVPQVVAPLRLKGRVHAFEAQAARAHTARRLKFTLPGPMTIIDTIAEHGARVQDPYELTALVRLSLGRAITQSVFPGNGDLEVVGLDANLERILTQALSAGGGTGLEPGLADTLLRETQAAVSRQERQGLPPVLLVQHPLRSLLSRFLRRSLPQLKVLSYAEVPDTRNVKMTALIGGQA